MTGAEIKQAVIRGALTFEFYESSTQAGSTSREHARSGRSADEPRKLNPAGRLDRAVHVQPTTRISRWHHSRTVAPRSKRSKRLKTPQTPLAVTPPQATAGEQHGDDQVSSLRPFSFSTRATSPSAHGNQQNDKLAGAAPTTQLSFSLSFFF